MRLVMAAFFAAGFVLHVTAVDALVAITPDWVPAPRAAPAPAARRKLSYKEQRELEQLPARIEQLEQEQRELTQRLADPALYREQAQQVASMRARFDAIELELGAALQRWQDLEDLG